MQDQISYRKMYSISKSYEWIWVHLWLWTTTVFPNFYDFHLSLRIIKQPIQNYIHSLNQVLCLHEHLSMPRLRITIFKKNMYMYFQYFAIIFQNSHTLCFTDAKFSNFFLRFSGGACWSGYVLCLVMFKRFHLSCGIFFSVDNFYV